MLLDSQSDAPMKYPPTIFQFVDWSGVHMEKCSWKFSDFLHKVTLSSNLKSDNLKSDRARFFEKNSLVFGLKWMQNGPEIRTLSFLKKLTCEIF